jgi:hypothetical protein
MTNSKAESGGRYEPPRVRVLGPVHVLTQVLGKQLGHSDGILLLGVTNTS